MLRKQSAYGSLGGCDSIMLGVLALQVMSIILHPTSILTIISLISYYRISFRFDNESFAAIENLIPSSDFPIGRQRRSHQPCTF